MSEEQPSAAATAVASPSKSITFDVAPGQGAGEEGAKTTADAISGRAADRRAFAHSTFEQPSEGEPDRERWGSRLAFYLAAVGSAVGFGNVWRFPALAKEYGGGAFFVPYILAVLVVGLPTLLLEIALGQVCQTGNVGVWGTFHRRLRGVGMASVACAFCLVVYYSMLLTWVTRAFFESFGTADPWDDGNTTGTIAVEYFNNEIIGMETLQEDLKPGRIVPQNVGYSFLVWLTVFLCLAFGLKWTGRVAYFTMGLPIVLLFVFLGRACSLEGANIGIKEYIGIWDMSVLTERPDVWSTAVSQIFFSLSVTFGTMTAYGSGCPRGEPAFLNSYVVGCSNVFYEFIAGFAVFAALGHLSYVTGVPVNDIPFGGFKLVFGTWPVVFSSLPGGENWVRLLFFNLYLLGIDSAFSILEGPITVCMDWIGHKSVAKWKIVGIFCTVAWLLSLIYATDTGLLFLDVVDYYINFVLLLIGFMETFSAGWVYGIEQQVANLGKAIVLTYTFGTWASLIIAVGLWFGIKSDAAVWAGFVALIVGYLATFAVTAFLCKNKMAEEPDKWTWKQIMFDVTLSNVFDLKDQLSALAGYMPALWAVMMRHCIPQILFVLFINLCRSENADGDSMFGHYESYPTWPYQVLGILCVALSLFLFLIGAAVPDLFLGADLPARRKLEAEAKNATEGKVIDESGAGKDDSVGKADSAGDAEDNGPPIEC